MPDMGRSSLDATDQVTFTFEEVDLRALFASPSDELIRIITTMSEHCAVLCQDPEDVG